MRIIRESLTALAALLALALLALAAVPPFLDWNAHRAFIARFLSERTGQPVHLGGDIRLVFLPQPELDADLVSIGRPERPAATIGRLTVSLSPLALARGVVQITHARADRVVVRGEAFDALGASAMPRQRLGVDRLDIRDLTILRPRSEAVLAQGLDLSLEAPDLAGPFRFDLNERLQSREWRGQVGRIEDGRARLRATVEDHRLASRGSLEGWIGLPGRADIALFDGSIQFNGNPLVGERLEASQVPFDGQARLMVVAGQVIADPLMLSLGPPERPLALNGKVFVDLQTARPSLRLELAGRRLDLSPTPDTRDGLSPGQRLWRGVSLLLASGGKIPALPGMEIEADFSLAALQLGSVQTQDVRLSVAGPIESLRLESAEARLPAGASLRFRRAGLGTVPLDGEVGFDAPDLGGLTEAMGFDRQRGLPASARLQSRLRLEGTELLLPDFSIETPGGRLAGDVRLSEIATTPRLQVALDGERFDARLLALVDPMQTGGPPLPVEGRLAIRELLYEGSLLGGIRLAFSRDGAASRLDELILRGRAGEELRLSGRFADGTLQATAKLDAEKLDDLARIAEAVAPGLVTQAIRARADRLSPALAVANIRIGTREGESIWDIQAEGRFGGSALAVKTHSELRGQAMVIALSGEIENNDGGQLLAQIGGGAVGPGLRGPGRVRLSVEGNPRRQLSTDLEARLAGTEIRAEGIVDPFRRSPFDGRFRLETVDLAPLHRALGGGAPVLATGTPARIAGRYFAEPTKLTLTQFVADIGAEKIEGEISFDFARAGQVAGQLRMGELRLPTLIAPALSRSAAGNERRFARGTAPFLTGDLWIEARRLAIDDRLVLDQPKFVLRFAPDLAAIEGLEAEAGAARLSTTVTIARRQERFEVAGNLGFDKLPWPGGTGRISGELPFTGQGASEAELTSSLAGAGRLVVDGLAIGEVEPSALARVLARPLSELQPIDENRLGALVEQELRTGKLTLPPLTMPLTLVGGVARLSPPSMETGEGPVRSVLAPSAILDLPRGSYDLRLGIRLAAAPKGWRGAPPEIALVWNGRTGLPPGPPRRSLQVSALLNGLLAIGLQRDLETIEAFEADARERAFFLRRSRADAEAERRRQVDSIGAVIQQNQ